MTVIGIDPGRTGAACVIWGSESICRQDHIEFLDTPLIDTGKKTVYNLKRIGLFVMGLASCAPLHAFIEKVQPQPKTFGASPNFHLGYSLGMWEAFVSAAGIPYTLVAPVTWKKAMMAGMGKEKEASIARALQIYPHLHEELKLKKHHGRADALLIASYGFSFSISKGEM